MSDVRLFFGPPPLRKSAGEKPPPGYHAAPGSKHGGFTDGHGGYWYPGHSGTVHAITPGGGPGALDLTVKASGPSDNTFSVTSHPQIAQPGRVAIVHRPTGRVVGQVKPHQAVRVVEALHDQHGTLGGTFGGVLSPKDFASVRATMATASAAGGAATQVQAPVAVASPLPTTATIATPTTQAAPLAHGLPASAAGLTFVKGKPGGAQAGAVVASPEHPGQTFMLKPASPRKVAAEAAGSTLAALVLGDGAVVRAGQVSMAGSADPKIGPGVGVASIQEMRPNGGALPKDTAGLVALSPDLHVQLIASHVGNWLASDHDAHGGQYLRTPDGKGLVKIDFAQSFKHLGEDKLDTGYHPNAAFDEAKPAPLKLLEAFAGGQLAHLDLNDPRIEQAVAAAEAIPDATIKSVAFPYEAAGGKPIGDQLLARRDGIRAAFEGLFSKVLSKRAGKPVAFKFGQAPQLVKAAITFGPYSLRKTALDTGHAPMMAPAIYDDDGVLTPAGERLAGLFAGAVRGLYGDQVVRLPDAVKHPALRAAITKLSAAPGLINDILGDAATRAEMAS